MMIMNKPRPKVGPSVLQRVRRNWDAALAVAACATFWIFAGLSDRPLEPAGPAIFASIALGSTIGIGSHVAARWIDDRLAKDEYGELIDAIDPDQSRLQRPYLIMAYAGLTTSILGIILAVTLNEFPRFASVFLYGILLGLALYCILGTMTLVGITRRHQRRAGMLRSIKEQEAREHRIAKRDAGGGPADRGTAS